MAAITDLPDPLVFNDGRRVAAAADWPARRAEILETLQSYQYGQLPPAPDSVTARLLHPHEFGLPPAVVAAHYRLICQPSGFSFLVTLYLPAGSDPCPVIVHGDGCWRYLTDEVLAAIVARGYGLASFNRVEIVPDNYTEARDDGLYRVFPDGDYGALAAWAWGYQRVVDFLQTTERCDRAKIAVTGASRGGKTALLAGATDERIALTVPHISGAGGAGCYRFPDPGGERLADLIAKLPYWFTPRLRAYVGRESELPFDQHYLKAAVAPRALLSTDALADLWASPHGTRLTYEAARVVYRLLGAESRIGIWYREGGHAHTLPDWEALLDFADLQFHGKPAARDFDMKP